MTLPLAFLPSLIDQISPAPSLTRLPRPADLCAGRPSVVARRAGSEPRRPPGATPIRTISPAIRTPEVVGDLPGYSAVALCRGHLARLQGLAAALAAVLDGADALLTPDTLDAVAARLDALAGDLEAIAEGLAGEADPGLGADCIPF